MDVDEARGDERQVGGRGRRSGPRRLVELDRGDPAVLDPDPTRRDAVIEHE